MKHRPGPPRRRRAERTPRGGGHTTLSCIQKRPGASSLPGRFSVSGIEKRRLKSWQRHRKDDDCILCAGSIQRRWISGGIRRQLPAGVTFPPGQFVWAKCSGWRRCSQRSALPHRGCSWCTGECRPRRQRSGRRSGRWRRRYPLHAGHRGGRRTWPGCG